MDAVFPMHGAGILVSTTVNMPMATSIIATKTISTRLALADLAQIQASLRPDETTSGFLHAAVLNELARRRSQGPQALTLGDIGEMSQAVLNKSSINHSLLSIIDSKLSRLMQELDVNP